MDSKHIFLDFRKSKFIEVLNDPHLCVTSPLAVDVYLVIFFFFKSSENSYN